MARTVLDRIPPAPAPPVLSSETLPRERAAAQCDWLQKRLKWATENQLPERDVATISSQLNAAMRLHAKLSGALDVTETQILRSAPWARIAVIIREALAPHPKALEAVAKALQEVDEGKKT